MYMYCSLVLRDFAFIEHHFFYNIAILTKLNAKIWFKLLESAHNNILPWLFNFPQNRRNTKTPAQFEGQNKTTPDGLQSLDHSSAFQIWLKSIKLQIK